MVQKQVRPLKWDDRQKELSFRTQELQPRSGRVGNRLGPLHGCMFVGMPDQKSCHTMPPNVPQRFRSSGVLNNRQDDGKCFELLICWSAVYPGAFLAYGKPKFPISSAMKQSIGSFLDLVVIPLWHKCSTELKTYFGSWWLERLNLCMLLCAARVPPWLPCPQSLATGGSRLSTTNHL